MPGIQWLPWGEKAFQTSKRERKPIILDIHGLWCHWCHVMDEKTYSDPVVTGIISSRLIPVRVDTDERPDINDRYNQGGWPSTVFLNGHGESITGATYLTQETLVSVIQRILENYEEFEKIPLRKPEASIERAEISTAVFEEACGLMVGGMDMERGGFGEQMKFPMAEPLELLLQRWRISGDDTVMRFVTKTADAMLALSDRLEGGFFRYATQRDWSVPHYEKMLETNASLIGFYSRLHSLTKEGRYIEAARSAAGYVISTLAKPGGGFCSSQDADGEEKYYAQPVEERRKMETPFIDKNVYTNLTSKMVSALAAYLREEDNAKIRKHAVQSAEILLRLFDAGKGMPHYSDPRGSLFGLITDNIESADALLSAAECFVTEKYRRKAFRIIDFILENFADDEGVFLDRLCSPSDQGRLKFPQRRLDINSRAARLLIRARAVSGESRYLEAAEKSLEAFAASFGRHGSMAAEYGLAVWELLAAKR